MRYGITILPEHRWPDAAPLWRASEEMGFDHAWTYDHLVWAGLPDAPWFGTTPTLTAAATVTSTIKLGTFVSSPNYRHPVTFMRDVLALDDISGGRFLCGIGAGGDLDAQLLGGQPLSPRQRADRFEEFVTLLDRLLHEDHVSASGTYFPSNDARTLPGPIGSVPLLLAANGPRAVKLAATFGAGWVTYGQHSDSEEGWWTGLRSLSDRMSDSLSAAGRDPAAFQRYLNPDVFGRYALESPARFEDMVGRAAELGFTDFITHWPRPESPYAGSIDTLETVCADVLPRMRG